MQVILSRHSQARTEERGIDHWQVEFVVKHGTAIRKAGATFYVFRKRDLAWLREAYGEETLKKVANLIVLEDEGVVITAYRNSRALKEIATRDKFDRRGRGHEASGSFWPDAA